MKKLFTISLALLATCSLLAQIPNGGMEDWTKGNSGGNTYYDPTGWVTLNYYTALINEICVAKDSTDVHSGKYAALLTTISLPVIGGVQSLIALGQIDNETVSGGIPFTQRPSSFDGYFKYAPASGSKDSCLFAAYLTRWNSSSGKRDSVGIAYFISSQSLTTYTLFNAQFIYFSSENPDTMQVFIASSVVAFNAPVGTQLKVDDLTLSSVIGIPSLLNIYNVSYYPNPVSDQLNVVFNEYEKASRIEVYNILGNRITSVSVRGKITPIPVAQFSPGMYFFRIIGKDGAVLKTDNFNKVN